MKRKKLLSKFKITEESLERVSAGIQKGERSTTGEIAVALIEESADYSFHELAFSLLLGALVTAFLIPLHGSIEALLSGFFWEPPVWSIALFYGTTGFFVTVITFFFANIPAIDRSIIPRPVRERHVYNRAIRHFVESGIYSTEAHTGILIFISWMEREVRLLADTGIAAKIHPQEWKNITADLARGISSGQFEHALEKAVSECGTLLASYFPATGENPNELENTVIVLEKDS